MATKRSSHDKRKSGEKTDPRQIGGIPAAAIEGAAESSEIKSENTGKMARPGSGMDIGRQMHRGSPPNDASHAPESGTERDGETDRGTREISRDEI